MKMQWFINFKFWSSKRKKLKRNSDHQKLMYVKIICIFICENFFSEYFGISSKSEEDPFKSSVLIIDTLNARKKWNKFITKSEMCRNLVWLSQLLHLFFPLNFFTFLFATKFLQISLLVKDLLLSFLRSARQLCN